MPKRRSAVRPHDPAAVPNNARADHLITLGSGAILIFILAAAGETESARMLGEDTLRRTRSTLGADNLVTVLSAAGLTTALAKLGQTDQARAAARTPCIGPKRRSGPTTRSRWPSHEPCTP
jgi:hypothetical protein